MLRWPVASTVVWNLVVSRWAAKGPRGIAEEKAARAKRAAMRRELNAMHESGAYSPDVLQAASDEVEAMSRPEIEDANLRDQNRKANRSRGAGATKGKRASPMNRADQLAEREARRATGAPDQGQDNLPTITKQLAAAEMERARKSGELNAEQQKHLETAINAITGEIIQTNEQLKRARAYIDSFLKGSNDRRRAAQAGLAN